MPVQRSNKLSSEATEVERCSFVVSNEPVRNECEVICEKAESHSKEAKYAEH